ITTVDSTGDVGIYTSIAIGSDGLPVISYKDETNTSLKVAKCDNQACSGSPTITTVDNTASMGNYTSIAIGSDGLPIISYRDVTNTSLTVAKCDNQAWSGSPTITTVDNTGNEGIDTSIAIGSDGLPIISYRDLTNTSLKVAKCGSIDC